MIAPSVDRRVDDAERGDVMLLETCGRSLRECFERAARHDALLASIASTDEHERGDVSMSTLGNSFTLIS